MEDLLQVGKDSGLKIFRASEKRVKKVWKNLQHLIKHDREVGSFFHRVFDARSPAAAAINQYGLSRSSPRRTPERLGFKSVFFKILRLFGKTIFYTGKVTWFFLAPIINFMYVVFLIVFVAVSIASFRLQRKLNSSDPVVRAEWETAATTVLDQVRQQLISPPQIFLPVESATKHQKHTLTAERKSSAKKDSPVGKSPNQHVEAAEDLLRTKIASLSIDRIGKKRSDAFLVILFMITHPRVSAPLWQVVFPKVFEVKDTVASVLSKVGHIQTVSNLMTHAPGVAVNAIQGVAGTVVKVVSHAPQVAGAMTQVPGAAVAMVKRIPGATQIGNTAAAVTSGAVGMLSSMVGYFTRSKPVPPPAPAPTDDQDHTQEDDEEHDPPKNA